ncbi:MAG: hypothetical protein COV66_05070 [Nitrospinae bacterium CG11_big_fil_rev_8_21_14_0_20_45_15]|nr:MAG: hypothetical protein COV66_05070 [Nitrospinae bacterium CG11_big_fil_rev_8_21_14_0_20_45_15]
MKSIPFFLFISLFLFSALTHTVDAEIMPVPDQVYTGHELINDWDIEQAEKLALSLLEKFPESGDAHFLLARIDFFKSNYALAVDRLKHVGGSHQEVTEFKMMAKETLQVTEHFVTRESEHFIFRYPEGSDEVLLPFAEEALEKSYKVLGDILDFHPGAKVVIEIYPGREALSRVSPLTLQDIETSGTVALCKYNRIMIISPRYLVRGYNWLDTLSHEFVHYLLTRKSRNRFPLWLHEGAAKFLETRWRDEKHYLSPIMETVLAGAFQHDYYIPLENMMPSLAKLKSAEDVQLAYAEVSTMMEYIAELKGDSFLSQLLTQLAQGNDFQSTLEIALGTSLSEFQDNWKKRIRKLNLSFIPGHKTLTSKFKKGGQDSEEAAYLEIEEKRTRDLVFLADILKSRNFVEAAVLEYEKAVNEAETLNPIVYNKLAGTYLRTGKNDQAEALLMKSLKHYPHFHTTLLNLGETYLQSQRYPQAQKFFEEAQRVNPFNPIVYDRLIQIYTKQGLSDKKEFQEQLRRHIK